MPLKLKTLLTFASLVFFLSYSKADDFVPSSKTNYFELSLQELLAAQVSVVSDFEESLVDAMASVHHIDSSQWQPYGVIRNNDVLTMFPSVVSYTSLGGSETLAIRGYSQSLSIRGIATLIDGVSMNNISTGTSQYGWEFISLGLLDGIDLVLGPGSVQNGSDAFHGTLSFNTYYRENNENTLQFSGNSVHEQSLTWRYSQLLSNNHFLNVAVEKLNKNNTQRQHWSFIGEEDELVRQDLTESYDVTNALFKLHNNKSNKTNYQLTYLHSNTQGEGFPGGGELLGFITQDVSSIKSNMNLFSGTLSQFISSTWTLGVNSHFMNLNRLLPYQGPAILAATHKVDKYNVEVFGKYQNKQKGFRAYVGLDYNHQNINDARVDIFDGDYQKTLSFTPNDIGLSRGITSFVAQARQKFTDWNTDIELGFRVDNYSDFGTRITPRVGLIKYWDDKKQTLKFLYGNAFRAAVSVELKGSPSSLGDPKLKPETVDTVELIYSLQFGKTSTKFTLFYSKWEDGITLVPITDPFFRSGYQNIAASNSWGFEGNYLYISDNWRINNDLSYTESEDQYRNINYSAYPKYIWNMQIDYQINPTSNIHIKQHILYDMTSGHDNDNNEKLPTYIRLDLGYSYQVMQQLIANINVNNLLNRANQIPSVFNSPKGIFDDERSIGIEFIYTFL